MTDQPYQDLPATARETRQFFKLFADIAARSDIPPAAKVLHAIIADHVASKGFDTPGTRLLSRESGLDRTTVNASVSRLEETGLLTVERTGNGRRNRYRTGGEIQPAGNSIRSENPTGGKSQPAAEGKSSRKRPENPTTSRQTLSRQSPQPPKGGEAGDLLLQVTGRAEAAYREVFGTGLPAKWKRRIEKECRDGDGHALDSIDAAAIRGGQSMARAAKGTFGFAWVQRMLADRAAVAVRSAGRTTAETPEAKATREQLEADRQRRDKELSSAMQAHFDGLPKAEREKYLAAVARKTKRPDLLTAFARAEAWRDIQTKNSGRA